METNHIARIIRKYLSERFSKETEERVQRWIVNDNHQKEKEAASFDYWNELDVKPDADTYAALKRVNQRIGYKPTIRRSFSFPAKTIRMAALCLLLLIPAGGYLLYTSTKPIEVFAAYGEEKHLLLPDRSEVWLNAGTTLRYPRKFSKENRVIYLDGEAYFSVEKDESRPFIVETEMLTVKVLGTQFNIKAYSGEEKAVTTLKSGKVEVHTPAGSPQTLVPNDQLILHTGSSAVEVVKVAPAETDSWRRGELIFVNASFREICQTLEKRFKVTITDRTEDAYTQLYTVKFLKEESLEEIITVLQELIGFTCHRQGNQLIIK